MTREEFLEYHRMMCEKMHAISKAKNQDYTGGSKVNDAFANFKLVEEYGITDAPTGFLTRMSDKVSRIISLLTTGKQAVKDESVQDTLIDLANYCILLAGYLESVKREPEQPLKGLGQLFRRVVRVIIE